ncbi:MAG: glycoside hydrolase family 2 TIM barrel-domain containing protein [Arachidicoccus sp.]|nr:glycoside hydrolase family 2 TIM barrel-domain containing protein [Arachidicoccus sp.]
MQKLSRNIILFIINIFLLNFLQAQQTEKIFLSGTGSDNVVKWQFYCTAGRNSGKWTTINVPSNWELQGFGTYNYGLDKDSMRTNEKGMYKYRFQVPDSWKNKDVNIVFDGSMTDTKVLINGQSAGAIHQGSFYRFKYDIKKLLHYGKLNLLEVIVSKNSANESVNNAERKGDFWIFGGIYRPVYLEAFPQEHIERVSVNALADGHFDAYVFTKKANADREITAQLYDMHGKMFGEELIASRKINDSVYEINANFSNPKLWSPEFPNLYKVVFSLKENGKIVHHIEQKFGFRTIEVRLRDGIYVNGVKIRFKGVNRHSFWPSTGRTTSKTLSIADVLMMKDMNMNAVRMSHYPPDDHFLDVCDSLGMFVLDELTGWHHAYDTQVGSLLVKEMVEKDENHPSIVLWDNGNEGGFNFELDSLFDVYDLQKRVVIHPWAVFHGFDTQHYINYDYGNGTHLHGHNIVFPTEFLHGLYDGGAGAGLYDYWEEMWRNPLSAGGFIWAFADEDVVRTDKNNSLDSDGDHAPDGIVGPYHEKEGSYLAIKEIWSPVYIEHREITPAFNGNFRIENRFFYTNINQCTFHWKLSKFSLNKKTDSISGTIISPDIAAGQFGMLKIYLPENFSNYDVLYVSADDPYGREIYTWSYPIKKPQEKVADLLPNTKDIFSKIELDKNSSTINIHAGVMQYFFNRSNGVLEKVLKENVEIPFNNGPILCEGNSDVTSFNIKDLKDSIVLTASFSKQSDMSHLSWTIYSNGILKLDIKYFPAQYDFDFAGISFSFPEELLKGIRWIGNGPYRVWKNRMQGTTLDIWSKTYNNTVTGKPPIIYPEFKGYYSGFYAMDLQTTAGKIKVICADEDVFLRLFTPDTVKKMYNTAPRFPSGDISFMHAIDAIGTKSQTAENTGPAGRKNMYYDYGKDKDYVKSLTLYFDFSGKE